MPDRGPRRRAIPSPIMGSGTRGGAFVDARLVGITHHVFEAVCLATVMVDVNKLTERSVAILGHKRTFEPAFLSRFKRVGNTIGRLQTLLVDNIARLFEDVS